MKRTFDTHPFSIFSIRHFSSLTFSSFGHAATTTEEEKTFNISSDFKLYDKNSRPLSAILQRLFHFIIFPRTGFNVAFVFIAIAS